MEWVYKSRLNQDYQLKARDDVSTFIEEECDTIFVEIKSIPNKLIIGQVYRVPNMSDELSIKRYIHTITKVLANKHTDAILTTDQNYDYIQIKEYIKVHIWTFWHHHVTLLRIQFHQLTNSINKVAIILIILFNNEICWYIKWNEMMF